MGILDNFMPGETGGMSSGVQGLLANPMLQIGLGILANNTGHYGALGPAIGLGAQQGFSNLQRQQSLQQQEQLRNLQIQQAKREADAQDRQIQEQKALSDAIGGAYSAPSAAPNMSFMDANNQAMAGQTPDYQWNPTPASFNSDALLKNVLTNPAINGTSKLSLYQMLHKDNTPIKVGKGETLLNPDTFSPLYTAPAEAQDTFGKINPSEYTPDSIRAYMTSKNPADLVASKQAAAPTTRQMRVGTNDVTQQWNPDTKKWDVIATGSAFKPDDPNPFAPVNPAPSAKPRSKLFKLDNGGSVSGTLDPTTGKYFTTQNGKRFWINE